MELRMRVAVLFCLAIAPGFAGSWSGSLVDSNCYDILVRNVNPFETSPGARDWGQMIQYCAPSKKTKAFAVVLDDLTRRKLDSNGNSKAAELVRKVGKKSRFVVVVAGEVSGKTLKVDSISLR